MGSISDDLASEANELSQDTFRSPRWRAVATEVLLAVFGIVMLVSIFSTCGQRELLVRAEAGEAVTQAELVSSDELQASVSVLYFWALLAVGITFLMWNYRVSKNLSALQVTQHYTPKWTIGYWLIPVVWWFRPYQAMKEIWKGSHPQYDIDSWGLAPVSRLLGFWWALWIVSSSVMNMMVSQMYSQAETASAFIGATEYYIVQRVLYLLAAILLFVLVIQITRNQERKHRAILEQERDRAVV